MEPTGGEADATAVRSMTWRNKPALLWKGQRYHVHTTHRATGQVVQDWRCPNKAANTNIFCTGRATTLGEPEAAAVGDPVPVTQHRSHSDFCRVDSTAVWADHHKILIRARCMAERELDAPSAIDDELSLLRHSNRPDVAALVDSGRASLANSIGQLRKSAAPAARNAIIANARRPGGVVDDALQDDAAGEASTGVTDEISGGGVDDHQLNGEPEPGASGGQCDAPQASFRRRAPIGSIVEYDVADLSQKTPMGNPVLTAASSIYPDVLYSFSLHKKKGNFTYFRCKGCPAANKLYRPVVVRVSNLSNRLATDVDRPNRPHICVARAGDGRYVHALSDEGRRMRKASRWAHAGVDPGDLRGLETGHTAKSTAAGCSKGKSAGSSSASSGKRRSGRPLDPLDAIAMAGADGMVDDDLLRRLANGAHEDDEEAVFDVPSHSRHTGAAGVSAVKRRAGRRQSVGVRAQLELDALAEELRHRRRLNEIAEGREAMAIDAELLHMSECNQLAQQRMQLENSLLELKKAKLDLRLQKLRSGELPIEALAESGSELGDGEEEAEHEQPVQTDGDGAADGQAEADGVPVPDSAVDVNATVQSAGAGDYGTLL